MTRKVYPGVPADESEHSDTEASAREGDSREEPADNRCGAETTDGTPCARPIADERERCWQHRESGDGDGESEERAPPATVERRLGIADVPTNALDANTVAEAVESHDGDVFEGVAYKQAPGDTRATAATKAVARERHGSLANAASYLKNPATFGECAHDGCERFANGYARTTCNRHDPPEPQDNDGSPENGDAPTDAHDGDGGITVKLSDGTVMSGLTFEQAREIRREHDG